MVYAWLLVAGLVTFVVGCCIDTRTACPASTNRSTRSGKRSPEAVEPAEWNVLGPKVFGGVLLLVGAILVGSGVYVAIEGLLG